MTRSPLPKDLPNLFRPVTWGTIRGSSREAALCFLKPWHIVGLVALGYIALTLARYGGNPMQFALVGSRFDLSVAGGTWGYDGQGEGQNSSHIPIPRSEI